MGASISAVLRTRSPCLAGSLTYPRLGREGYARYITQGSAKRHVPKRRSITPPGRDGKYYKGVGRSLIQSKDEDLALQPTRSALPPSDRGAMPVEPAGTQPAPLLLPVNSAQDLSPGTTWMNDLVPALQSSSASGRHSKQLEPGLKDAGDGRPRTTQPPLE